MFDHGNSIELWQFYGGMESPSRRKYLEVTVGISSVGSQWRTRETAQSSPFQHKLPSSSSRRFQINHKTLSPLVMFIR